jgi:hypothetical protein
VLNERLDKVFELSFHLDTTEVAEAAEPDAPAEAVAQGAASAALIPEYVSVEVTP